MKGLYKKTNGFWYYQAPKLRGQPRPKAVALGTQDELDAVSLAREKQENHDILRAETVGTIREVLPRYYECKAEDTMKTRRARKQVLDAFTEMMGNPRLRDIDVEMLQAWRKKLSTTGGTTTTDKPVSPSTMTGYLIILKAFLNWVVENGMMKTNPAKAFKGKTTVRVTRAQNFIDREKRDLLLAEPCRDYVGLILHLGFFAGLRDGEMLACNPDWIWIAADGKSGSLTVQHTEITMTGGRKAWWRAKGKAARTIPLHPRLIAFLRDYGMRRPYLIAPDKPYWPEDEKNSKRFDAKKALRNHGLKCGVPNLAYHILRHSFGTHLSISGVPMNQIAGLLGNTIRVTEQHYIGFSASRMDALSGL